MEYMKAHNMEGSYMMSMYDKQVAYGQDHKLINNIREEFNEYNDTFVSESTSSNSLDDSNISKESSSSDLTDDASSSSSANGPLYELQGLMDQLPIKRGLSKFYQGKSQSFTSLARVTSLEDLAKKETPYQKKLNASRSYAGGLNNSKSYTQLKPTISKKNSKGSFSNLSCLRRRNSFIRTNRPPLSHVQSTF